MPLYTVLAPPVRAGDSAPDPMNYVFVKEGFSWPALIVPELWLLFRRMWRVLVVYLAVALVVVAIDRQLDWPLAGIFFAFAHLWLALEGNELRRRTLARRGYQAVDVVEGGRLSEAEIRFFLDWPEPAAMPPPPATPKPDVVTPAQPSAEAGEIVGLFPAPGGKT